MGTSRCARPLAVPCGWGAPGLLRVEPWGPGMEMGGPVVAPTKWETLCWAPGAQHPLRGTRSPRRCLHTVRARDSPRCLGTDFAAGRVGLGF